MDPEFVRKIDQPQSLQLQELQSEARESVETRLEQHRMAGVPDRVARKLTYAYYHDWITDDPEYVFLLADPGTPGEHVIFEVNSYLDCGPEWDLRDLIQIDRRFGARWLVKQQYTDFTAEFVEACRKNGLIDSDEPWWRYVLGGGFFGDFYMGDVIKYRDTSVSEADINASFSEFLIHELEHVNPELVFAFGKRAWITLQDRLGAEPVSAAPASSSVHDTHGVLHETNRLLETAVLPLGHPSPNFRGAQISHDEYMAGLLDGIEEWAGDRFGELE